MSRCCRRMPDEGGPEPRGQGSRPPRAVTVPRVREEGAGGGFDQVAGVWFGSRSSGQLNRRRWSGK
jgi:hypothetical protein